MEGVLFYGVKLIYLPDNNKTVTYLLKITVKAGQQEQSRLMYINQRKKRSCSLIHQITKH